MNKNTARKIVNRVMRISLIVVLVTGMLLHPFGGMWLGILHGVSGFVLTISIIIHCFQNRRKRKAV